MNKYSVFFLCLVISLGCSKEVEIDNKDVKSNVEELSKVMTFTDWEEVLSTCKMNKDELSIFEEENKFESFATKSNKVYESIDLNNVKTVEEIYEFVEKNKQYVEIMIDEEGEKNFQPILYQHPIANVINESKEIRIGSEIYKLEIAKSDVLEFKSDGVTKTLDKTDFGDGTNEEGAKSFLEDGRACPSIFQVFEYSYHTAYRQNVNVQRGPKRATGYIEIRKEHDGSPLKFIASIKVQQRTLGIIWSGMQGQVDVSYSGEIYTVNHGAIPVNVVLNQWGSSVYMTSNLNVPEDIYFAPQAYTMDVYVFASRFWDAIDNAAEWLHQRWQCNEKQSLNFPWIIRI